MKLDSSMLLGILMTERLYFPGGEVHSPPLHNAVTLFGGTCSGTEVWYGRIEVWTTGCGTLDL